MDICIANTEIVFPVYFLESPSEDLMDQFKCRREFEAVDNISYNKNQLIQISDIIKHALLNEEDVVIVCNNNHLFTDNYTYEFLLENIFMSYKLGTRILLGGAESVDQIVPITENLCWIDRFNNACFFVIFIPSFKDLMIDYESNLDLSSLLSEITSNKMVIYPFISDYFPSNSNSESFNQILTLNYKSCTSQQKIAHLYRIKKIYLK